MVVDTQASRDKQITEKIAELLYLQAPVSNSAILVVALLYYFILRDYLPADLHFIWPLLMSFTAGIRLLLWYLNKHTPDRYSAVQWIRLYTLATGLAGLAWSSVLFFPYTHSDIFLFSALAMMVFGVTASAVAILAVRIPAFLIYVTPILTGFIIKLSLINFQEYSLLILSVFLYTLIMGLFARNTHEHIIKSILLEFHNQELINKLQDEVTQRESLVKARTKELEQSNQALSSSEQLLNNVINGAELGYWDYNLKTGEHTVNDRWLEMLGLTHSDIDNNISDWESRVHPEDRKRLNSILEKAITDQKPYSADFRMKHRDGHWVWIQGSCSVIEYDKQTGEPLRLCGTHQDITYRKNIEMELDYQAKHDFLTGLNNRVELEKHFKEELLRTERYNHSLSIFMIDIDHFKRINDRYGHQAGDNVLKLFADFLLSSVRTSDYVARYGGEEFVVILPETARTKAMELAERLRLKISVQDIELEQTTVNITISLGIASYPEHGNEYQTLLRMADTAMYKAKHRGRNRVEVAA